MSIVVKRGTEISNPRTGQRMIFSTTGAESAGQELVIDCWSPPQPPAEPPEPMHVHPEQEKRFRVIEGELTTLADGEQRVVRAGEELVIAPGVRHQFWNGGSVEAHYWQEFKPALRSAEFFVTLFSLARDGKLNARGIPSLLQLAASGSHFRHEIMVSSPPALLQRIAFVFLTPLAYLLGLEAERA